MLRIKEYPYFIATDHCVRLTRGRNRLSPISQIRWVVAALGDFSTATGLLSILLQINANSLSISKYYL